MALPGNLAEAVKAWLATQGGLRKAVIARRYREAYKRARRLEWDDLV